MKILVSYLFGNRHISLGDDIGRAFERDGHSVYRHHAEVDFGNKTLFRLLKSLAKPFALKSRLSRWIDAGTDRKRQHKFLQAVAEFAPEVVIVIRGEQISPTAIDQLPARGVKHRIVWWVKHPKWQRNLFAEVAHYDAAFCIDPSVCDAKIQHLPSWALNADRFFSTGEEKTIPLLFVGAFSERRQRYLETLADLPLAIIGPNWSTRLPATHPLRRCLLSNWVTPSELGNYYRRALIVVDIHQVEQMTTQGMNMRFADVPACGTVLLTEKNDDAANWLDESQGVLTYHGQDELRRRAMTLLDNRQATVDLGTAAATRVKQLPSFADRARTLIAPLVDQHPKR